MASRAIRQYQFGIIRSYPIEPGQQVVVGKTCKFGATAASGNPAGEATVQDAGAASDLAIGIVRPHAKAVAGVITAASLTANEQVEVLHPFSAIEAMLVGTGGTTAGKKQKVVADGITDAPANGGGTTDVEIVGIALQGGVVGDLVGVGLMFGSRVSA